MMSLGTGSYLCATNARHSDGRRWSGKRGVSATTGTVNQKCVFHGSDLYEANQRGFAGRSGPAAVRGSWNQPLSYSEYGPEWALCTS